MKPRFHVLLVDDEPDLVELLKLRLGADGSLRVEGAYDGAMALRLARTSVPDVILSDIQMPGMDAWELCAALRSDPRTRNIPLLLMTGWISNDIHERATKAGAEGLLIKPLDENKLQRALLDLAEGKRPSRPGE